MNEQVYFEQFVGDFAEPRELKRGDKVTMLPEYIENRVWFYPPDAVLKVQSLTVVYAQVQVDGGPLEHVPRWALVRIQTRK